ncbi:hypothetical protein TRIATDRAFT_77992 [Trichoderma atroviride IMI 206040]|uniref:Uncharacterized protein n=1 Tax=Hypocrea atroviridis (strain ATCC 20476 / IMI 206040) TaxID=452589 RepID=G9P5R9_HYPAI|nr:uncharacterized protein TRIATDRAFT_77992 [Trichoderma atroviride IMI 206040]EHK41361.1 hypothetical protein TRIATDRAFT_77992 [Trichoderma atroviride IMI 206040]
MSIFPCCGSRRRRRQPAGDVDLAEAPEEHCTRLDFTDIQHCFHQSRESIEMPFRLRNVAAPPPEPPSENPTELEIEQLVVDDSDGDGAENNTLTKTSSTNSALNVVRTKLARHMSNENETHRRSRASAGHSQEEVARRAELRRFRHQRIQEELKNEDNHAESSNTSHRSTSYLSPLIDAGQPRIGPRDTIEFTVADGPHPGATPALPTQESMALIDIPEKEVGSTTQEEGGEIKYPSILAVLTAGDRDRAPPFRPPSTHSNRSQKIAGCSYNSPRLDRVLGTDNEFDIRHGAHAWEEQSTLGIWLAAQGMRSRSSSIRATDNESNDKSAKDHACSHHQSFGAIDSAADAPLPIHCQGNTDMRPQAGDSYESASFASNKSNNRTIGGADAILPENNPLSGPNVLDKASAKLVDNSSSNYPSVLPSFQPSPDRSQPDFHHLSAQDLESLELSPFSWQGDFSVIKSIRASEGKSSYATAEDDIFYSDNNASSAQIIHPPAQTPTSTDATPIVGSTAAGIRPRETKARTIGAKLGNVLSRRKPSMSFGSRSKDEFPASSTGTGGRSLMSMINLSVPRRLKRDSSSSGTAPNRHCVNERDSPALARENPNNVRSGIPPHITSLFRPERSGLLSADLSDVTIKNAYNNQTPLTQRDSAAFETSRLTPHSDELPDEARSSSRRILQQLTANIQEAFSPSSTPNPTRTPRSPNRLAKTPPHLGDERAVATDPRQSQLDGGSSVSDALTLESGTRFQPAKLVKVMRSGFKKFMPSYGHEKQAQLYQPTENYQRHDEDEEHSQSKMVRLGTPSMESDHLKAGAEGAAECGTAPSHQQLCVDRELEAPELIQQLNNESDGSSSSASLEINVRRTNEQGIVLEQDWQIHTTIP